MNKLALTVLDRPHAQKTVNSDNVLGFKSPSAYENKTSQVIPITFSQNVHTLGRVIITTSFNDLAMVKFELWLFRQEPQVQADNTPFEPDEKDLASLLKVITFDVFKGSKIRVFQSKEESMPVPWVQTLYGVLVVRNPFTPAPDERFIFSVLNIGPD